MVNGIILVAGIQVNVFTCLFNNTYLLIDVGQKLDQNNAVDHHVCGRVTRDENIGLLLNGIRGNQRVNSLFPSAPIHPLVFLRMPRKAAAAADDSAPVEPRRSTRIKDQPKPEPVVKKAAAPKPKSKKAEKESGDVTQEKPKSGRGRKRKEPEPTEANGAEDEPPAKKVCRVFSPCCRYFTDGTIVC